MSMNLAWLEGHFGNRVISRRTSHPCPSLPRLDPARLLPMGVLEVEDLPGWPAEPDKAESRHQEGGSEASAEKRAAKFSVK